MEKPQAKHYPRFRHAVNFADFVAYWYETYIVLRTLTAIYPKIYLFLTKQIIDIKQGVCLQHMGRLSLIRYMKDR